MKHPFRALLIPGMLAVFAGPVEGATWLEARQTIEALARVGEYEAAAELEDELLALAEDEFGDTSVELAQSHLFLASMHAGFGDHAAAEQRILNALDIYERNTGPWSTQLIEPFLLLGDNYFEARDYELALGAYDEARTLGRRAFGLLNNGQLEILDRMSEAALGMGQVREADELQQEAITIAQRAYGEGSLEHLEAHYRYAQWLSDHRRFRDADVHYHEMGGMVRKLFDDDPWLQVRLLRIDAENFRRSGGRATGYRTNPSELEEALELVENLEEPAPLLNAEVLVDLGDWNVTFGRAGESADAYLEAWELYGKLDDGDDLRKQIFEELTVIQSAPFLSRMQSQAPDAPWGYLRMGFTVDTEGRAKSIVVLESDPPAVFDYVGVLQVSNSRFRPQIRDGRLVESERVMAWELQYDPRFQPRSGGQRAAEAAMSERR